MSRYEIVFLMIAMTSTGVIHGVIIPWSRELQMRTDLVCNATAATPVTSDVIRSGDTCTCCCEGRPVWGNGGNQTMMLYIEYLSGNGSSVVVSRPTNKSYPYHEIHHQRGLLRRLPGNVSRYAGNIVRMNLAYNAISTLEGLNHLHKLDTLNLTGNKLTTVENSTFWGLENLRVLDLSGNQITHVSPDLLNQLKSLVHVDFGSNHLREIDGTNVILDHPFCTLSFERNAISQVTNKLNKTLTTASSYGPGEVHLQHNAFESFFDLDSLGVKDISLIGTLLGLDLQITEIKWTCDCRMVPFLQRADSTVSGGWMGSRDIKCYNPSNLRNQSIIDLVRSGGLDLFNCSINEQCGCPRGCTCIDQPSQDRLVVNCSNTGLQELPDTLPKSVSRKIELRLGSNSIRVLNTTTYLSRVSVLDLTNNSLSEITGNAFEAIKNISHIYLQKNPDLRQIPKEIQSFDFSKLAVDDIMMDCNCRSEWVSTLQLKSNVTVTCMTEKGPILAKEFSQDFLNCNPRDLKYLWLGLALFSALAVVVTFGVLAYIFRCEIFLIVRKFYSLSRNHIHPIYEYDVYISFDEANSIIMAWVRNYLLPFLETSGYSVFLPARQLAVGGAHQDAVSNALAKCKSSLFILSERTSDAFDDLEEHCDQERLDEIEMIYFWNMFKKDMYRRIVIINFDNLSSSNISRKPYRAFLCLGLDIDVTDRRREFYKKLKIKLGKPQPHGATAGQIDTNQGAPNRKYRARQRRESEV